MVATLWVLSADGMKRGVLIGCCARVVGSSAVFSLSMVSQMHIGVL